MIQTLEWTDKGVRFIDQTKLPTEETYVTCKTYEQVADAIHKVNLPMAVAGPLDFASGSPAPGVAITPPVGVQWQKGTKYPLEMQVVDNTLQPHAKITADLKPTNQ